MKEQEINKEQLYKVFDVIIYKDQIVWYVFFVEIDYVNSYKGIIYILLKNMKKIYYNYI